MHCEQRNGGGGYCGGNHQNQNVSIVINYQGYIEMRINDIAKWRATHPLDTTKNYYIKFKILSLDLMADNINWIYETKKN